MRTNQVIILARKHLGKGAMDSSARLCLEEAVLLQSKGDLNAAKIRALKSLAYSVGILHSDYRKVEASGSATDYYKVAVKPVVGYLLEDPRGYYYGTDFNTIGQGYSFTRREEDAVYWIYKALHKRLSLQGIRNLMKKPAL